METTRTYHYVSSERCYRYKEEALFNHAPHAPGVYELVTFDAAGKPEILFIGMTPEGSTVFECLQEHWLGRRDPNAQELLKQVPNLYFDFIARTDAETPEDLLDLAWGLIQNHTPRLNPPGSLKHSNRYSKVEVIDETP